MKCDLCGTKVWTYYDVQVKTEAGADGIRSICNRCARLVTDQFTTTGSEKTMAEA